MGVMVGTEDATKPLVTSVRSFGDDRALILDRSGRRLDLNDRSLHHKRELPKRRESTVFMIRNACEEEQLSPSTESMVGYCSICPNTKARICVSVMGDLTTDLDFDHFE